jgi:murein DD-endopeptidase MepM/ murein hydrolase activator NlpD
MAAMLNASVAIAVASTSIQRVPIGRLALLVLFRRARPPTVTPTPTNTPTPTATSTPTPIPTATPAPKPFIEYAKQIYRPYSRNAQVSRVRGPQWWESVYHPGIDIDMPVGSPVFAALGGTVVLAEAYAPGCFHIYKQHEIDGFVFWTVYSHLAEALVDRPDHILACQRIASSHGDPNYDPYSTRPHIEFNILFENPADGYDYHNSYINEGNWETILDAMSFCD